MLQEMDTGPPSVDTFSNGSSKKCALAWSEFDDAISQNWSQQELLWMNPPFSKILDVVNKIKKERPRCLLLVPAWETEPWWEP